MPDWLTNLIQTLILGLSIGAIYALIAVGYTMVYGVLRLINFAHGDVYMVGAMTAYFVGTGAFQVFTGHWWMSPLLYLPVFAAVWFLLRRTGASQGLAGTAREASGTLAIGAAALTLGGLLSLLVTKVSSRMIAATADKPAHYEVQPSWVAIGLALIAAMVICGGLGLVIEYFAYRPLRKSPRINSLITAIGVSMLLMYGGQAIFGATPKPFPVPTLDNPFLFNRWGLTLGWIDAAIIAVTLVLMVGLTYIVYYTRTGLALRAVSHRFDTAALMGVHIDRIISFTFVLGSVLAASAGVLVSCKFPSVNPLMGLLWGLKAFVAAVLGGIGNIAGAVVGAVLLGIIENVVKTYAPGGSQWVDGVAFAILIGVLLLKPSGLLGGKTIEKV